MQHKFTQVQFTCHRHFGVVSWSFIYPGCHCTKNKVFRLRISSVSVFKSTGNSKKSLIENLLYRSVSFLFLLVTGAKSSQLWKHPMKNKISALKEKQFDYMLLTIVNIICGFSLRAIFISRFFQVFIISFN